uniref:Uncharacterized protein n=1 Tax=Fagus sylvatica TaxID=28930 RepID=A0A2N9G768_FAGSY
MALKHHFFLLSWCGARGSEGRHSQSKIRVPKPRKEEGTGPPRHPVVHGRLPSGSQPNPATKAICGGASYDGSVSTEASNDETPAGHFLYPLVAVDCITEWSTAAPVETEIMTKAEKTREVCHGHHHSRAVTTTAQHSGGPCSSTSQNLGSTVWR